MDKIKTALKLIEKVFYHSAYELDPFTENDLENAIYLLKKYIKEKKENEV